MAGIVLDRFPVEFKSTLENVYEYKTAAIYAELNSRSCNYGSIFCSHPLCILPFVSDPTLLSKAELLVIPGRIAPCEVGILVFVQHKARSRSVLVLRTVRKEGCFSLLSSNLSVCY